MQFVLCEFQREFKRGILREEDFVRNGRVPETGGHELDDKGYASGSFYVRNLA